MTEACVICGKSQKDRPAIFRNAAWCSENCRKAYVRKAH